MNRAQAEQLPDSTLVWFEAREPVQFLWQWWGWKKIDRKPVTMGQVRIYMMIAAAPLLMRGTRFRVRKARV